MHFLRYVLTVSVIFAAGTTGSITVAGGQAKVAAHTTSSTLPYTNKTLSLPIRVETLNDHALLQVQRDEERNVPLSAIGEAIMIGAKRIWVDTKTKLLTADIKSLVKKGKFVNEQKVFNTAKFVQLLSKKLRDPFSRWNYDKIISSLTNTEVVWNFYPTPISYEDLMKAFILLRTAEGMETHANSLQRALAHQFPVKLEPSLHALWLEAKYTPDDLVKILLTGHEEEFFLRVSRSNLGWAKIKYRRFVEPAFEYIEAYRKAEGKSYSVEDEKKLRDFVESKLVELIAKK